MTHSFSCPRTTTQVCLACGAQVCACHGITRGQCPVCFRGLLSQYYKPQRCRYKGCAAHAVAATPRVGFACLEHATERGGFQQPSAARIAEYHQSGPLAPYTATLTQRMQREGFPSFTLPPTQEGCRSETFAR